MSFLEDLIDSSDSSKGYGFFEFTRIGYENKQLLKSMTRRQRVKFRRERKVPLPGLAVLFNLGCLPGNEPPQRGMSVDTLLAFLDTGAYRDAKARARGVLVRDTIYKEEYPEPIFGDEKFVKQGAKFVPISFLRNQPGTML